MPAGGDRTFEGYCLSAMARYAPNGSGVDMATYAKEFVNDAEAKRLMGGAYDKALVKEARRAFGQSKRSAFCLLEDAGTPRPLIYELCQVRPQHVHNELNHRKREVTAVKDRPVSAIERRFAKPTPPRRRRSNEPSAARASLKRPGTPPLPCLLREDETHNAGRRQGHVHFGLVP